MGSNFDTNFFDIEINSYSNDFVYLTPHNRTNTLDYNVLSATNLTNPFWRVEWWDVGANGDTVLPALKMNGKPINFFRGVGSGTDIGVLVWQDDAIEPNASGQNGQDGIFAVYTFGSSQGVTAYYMLSGSATAGVDYTNLSGVVTIPPGDNGYVYIHPLQDTNIEFDETVTLTIVVSNNYVVYPPQSATLVIYDNLTNVFQTVATNLDSPVGIDYHAPSNALVFSYHLNSDGIRDFALIRSNGAVVTNWAGITSLADEVKVATVKGTANGWVNGDVYFGSDFVGGKGIGWLSADGTRSNLTWGVLTNGVVTNALPLRGGLYLDQTGVFSNQLVAIASDSGDEINNKGVWLVDTNQHVTLLTQIPTAHLEGAIVLTNDAIRWGPWAGKILTGDEVATNSNSFQPLIYAVDTNGFTSSYALGIAPEDFDIIPTNQDLYCVAFNTTNSAASKMLKLSNALLNNYVGDLLVTQAGEEPFPRAEALYCALGQSSGVFQVRSISLPNSFNSHFEHVTFAPINIPAL